MLRTDLAITWSVAKPAVYFETGAWTRFKTLLAADRF